MTSIKIVLDPARLNNPDLDIRYKLPEDIIRSFGDCSLIDDGYDYEDPGPLLAMYLRSDLELPKPSVERIIHLANCHDSLGEPLAPAMTIFVDAQLVFPSPTP
ncbi:MAG TPA: hypothetical protein VF472_13985 [Burkholderiaceae bacterium]